MERRFEQAIAAFRAAMRRDGPERGDRQRPGAGVRAGRLPDPRRPGPAVGPELPGEPLDVPRRAGRRAPDPDPPPAPRARRRTTSLFPILVERTPVRLDLSHSAWSDIFFLGMDYPEGARVLNISVDLGVHGRDDRAAAADRDPRPGDPRADPAADEHRPERLQGRDDARRAVQLRQRLPRAGQGRRDRLGPDPAVARGDRDAGSTTLLGAGGPAGARAGGRQQGQRHPQGVAAGGLDEPARLADQPPDAGDRPGAEPDRPARPGGGAGGRRPGDPRRVARRLGRRLAGLGGGLPRRQADPRRRRRPRPTPSGASAGAGSCPRTSCSTTGRPARPRPTSRSALAREPRPRPRRDGPERRADPEHGHEQVPPPQPRGVAGAAGGAGDLRGDRRGRRAARRPRARRPDDRGTGRGRSSGSSPGSATRSPRRSSPRRRRRSATTSGAS